MRNRWIYSIISFAFFVTTKTKFDSGNDKYFFLYNCSYPTSFHTICTPSVFYINFIVADRVYVAHAWNHGFEATVWHSSITMCWALSQSRGLSIILNIQIKCVSFQVQMTQDHHPCYAIQFNRYNYNYIIYIFSFVVVKMYVLFKTQYVIIIIRIYLFRSQVRLLDRERKLRENYPFK